jgi:hypothetical protein
MIREGRGTPASRRVAVRPYPLVASPHRLVANRLFTAEFLFGAAPILFR